MYTYLGDTEATILPSLNNFLASMNDLCTSSSNGLRYYNIHLGIKFITRITEQLEVDCNTTLKRSTENDLRRVANFHKWNTLNKDLKTCEKIKQDIQTKINRKNKIEHYFNIVDRQLQLAIKKKIMKSETIIVAAMKEHEHKMLNLEVNAKSCHAKIESNMKDNEIEKNKRIVTRNDLKTRKGRIVRTYDSEMMEKYRKMKEFNSKIKTIEDDITQSQELISRQLPLYNDVLREKEEENDRIWHSKLHEIQRKIAARKIQIHFRRYLAYIKTRDSKKNKKGQKKSQTKSKKN